VRKLVSTVIAVALLLGASAPIPSFGQTLRIAMTASDIPTATRTPNNDGEGFTRPDQIAGLTPGLAALWKIDDTDHTRWVFSLRPRAPASAIAPGDGWPY